jgi:hypothetical protein
MKHIAGLFALAIVATPALRAQTIALTPASAAPGGAAVVEMWFNAAPDSPALILQFDVTFPARQLTLQSDGMAAAKGPLAAGKSLTCLGRWKKAPETYVYRCMLAGGNKPIPDGAAVTATFQIPPGAKPGPASVQIEEIQVLATNLKVTKVRSSQGVVTITQ